MDFPAHGILEFVVGHHPGYGKNRFLCPSEPSAVDPTVGPQQLGEGGLGPWLSSQILEASGWREENSVDSQFLHMCPHRGDAPVVHFLCHNRLLPISAMGSSQVAKPIWEKEPLFPS